MQSVGSLVNNGVVKTVCQLCPWYCGINVCVEDGRIVKVEGMPDSSATQGYICPKGEHCLDYVYSENRLKYPLKKKNGGWEHISWDEALDTIASKLFKIKEEHGAKALAVCLGDPMETRGATSGDLALRFADLYGTPNQLRVGNFCFQSHLRAHQVTFGKFLLPDIQNAKCIVLWAHNPPESFPATVQHLLDSLERGAKLIVIDPRRTFFAERANVHLRPRPGTDTALALGMLNVIINEELYDREFIKEWTVGFDKLVEHVKAFPPREVERITWVPTELIVKAARMISTNKPGCVVQSVGTIDKHSSGFQSARAIAVLEAVIGNVGETGGDVRATRVRTNLLRLPEKTEGIELLGAEEYPLFSKLWGKDFGMSQTAQWAKVVLEGKPYPIRTLIVSGSNPAISWPNSNKFKMALEKLEFKVVMDIFMTATGEMADMVLPASSFFEGNTIAFKIIHRVQGQVLPYVMLGRQVIKPLWESWPDWKFWFELAKRMGYEEYFPWKDDLELLDYVMGPSGLTVKYLTEEKPEGTVWGEVRYKEHELKGFPTPSKKIEIYSETLEKLGYHPLPTHIEPPESPIRTPDLFKEYPLILNTSSRNVHYWHSQYRNIPKMLEEFPEPTAEIHPETAKKYSINDGDIMIVETKRGSIEIKAKFADNILPQLVFISHGWRDANVNLLTDETAAAPETGYPSLGSMLCKVRKK